MQSTVTASDQAYEEIRALCIQMCRADPSRLRVVKNEEDETTDSQPEAHEFLKIDEKRCGRDFKLYGLMAGISDNVGHALADFTDVIMAVKNLIPSAFETVRTTVEKWDRFFDERMRVGWRDLWN